jgi:polysaccharide export outer membrane protein
VEWGTIPLPSAKVDGEYSIAEVNMRSIENATSPEENIQVLPYDSIAVPKADVVYVIGEGVKQPGAFTLSDRKGISVIEALARAQGTLPAADVTGARVIHPVPGGNRTEIPVNIKDILKGKKTDIVLNADDILYIPRSELRGAGRRTLDAVVAMTTGAVIYRGAY